jgi:serine/threonine-protein kinase RsbW
VSRSCRCDPRCSLIVRNFELVLKGNLGELARLTAETERFCGEHALGPDVEFDLHLVLEELFVNSIRHGGCEGMEGAAEFQLTLLAGGVALEYSDRGVAFDLTNAPEPDLAAMLEERAGGGLGIHLVRQVMRDIEYYRVGGQNRIRMRRPIPAEGT